MTITKLNEHYRCHPKIIGFCNEKFYDNQLVIMTEEKPEDSPLKIFKTAPGNHARRDTSSNIFASGGVESPLEVLMFCFS